MVSDQEQSRFAFAPRWFVRSPPRLVDLSPIIHSLPSLESQIFVVIVVRVPSPPFPPTNSQTQRSILFACYCCRNFPATVNILALPNKSLQLIKMLQPRQNNLLARLLNLTGQEDLVQDGVDLVEVEDQVELAHVAEEGVEHFDKEVDRLQVGQLVVVGVDAGAEEEAGVPAVDDLVVAELDKVGLVLLVAGRDEAVDL